MEVRLHVHGKDSFVLLGEIDLFFVIDRNRETLRWRKALRDHATSVFERGDVLHLCVESRSRCRENEIRSW